MSFLSSNASLWRSTELDENLTSLPVERVVCAYEKEGDRLISEFVLQDANLAELQNLFDEPEQNSMIECYPIARTQADYLQKRFHLVFDFDAFDYFLECNAV